MSRHTTSSLRHKREKGRVHVKYRLRDDEHQKPVRHARSREDILALQEKEEPWPSNPSSPRPDEGSPKVLRRQHRGEEVMERPKKEVKGLNFVGNGGKSHLLADSHKYLKKNTVSVPVEITPPTPTMPTTDGTISDLTSGDNASPTSSFDGIDVALSTESSPLAILRAMEKE